jgi:hypothetical protein
MNDFYSSITARNLRLEKYFFFSLPALTTATSARTTDCETIGTNAPVILFWVHRCQTDQEISITCAEGSFFKEVFKKDFRAYGKVRA